MSISVVLRDRRQELGLTLKEIALAVGVSEATVQRWESGNIRNLRQDKIVKLADALRVSPAFLMGWEPLQPADLTPTIPVVASVAAGNGMCAVADFEGYHIAPPGLKNHDEYCYFRVKGESMAPDIKDGELVLVHLQPEVENGEIAVVIVNGDDGLVKRVQYQDDCMVLLSSNPAYPPRLLVGHDLDDVIIWGKVVYVWRAL